MDIHLSQVKVKVGNPERTLFHIPDLKISSGQKLLIKGASGKGKTTFLHLLSGLLVPSEGEVRIGETLLSRMSEDARAVFRREHVGIVLQKLNLIEHLTAAENIELALRERHDSATAGAALKAVGLAGRESDRTAVMSLGEQQRVAIARVLAGGSRLIFADEPTSSLDEANALEVAQLLHKASADKTLIVVSHDHRIEKYFSDIREFTELCQ